MRISDWSSDVCSSDLLADGIDQRLDRTGFVDVEPASMAAGRSQALADRGRARVAGRGADDGRAPGGEFVGDRSEEHTSELQSLMRISYAVFCLKKKKNLKTNIKQSRINTRQLT